MSMVEQPVRIENRTQLVSVLSEAAELEHGINCCYLFAAMSIKTGAEEAVAPEHLNVLKRWKGDILGIAIDEMLHLALVNNLLAALGAAPHFRRPNLPASPTMYPPSFQLALRPFNEETLQAFVFLERPEGVAMAGEEVPASRWPRPIKSRDIFSDRPEYRTVGHLYRGIEDGFRYLAEKLGEERLFVGRPEAQTPDYPGLDGLIGVTDLNSAVQAIQRIVEQGEGARENAEHAHYTRFRRIQAEYEALRRDHPAFTPGRPVLENPYTHVPADILGPARVGLVDDPKASALCNLLDGAYDLLIEMLGRYFLHNGETDDESRLLAELASGLMVRVIGPLGSFITTLPAGPAHPGLNAGPGFSFSRNTHTPPHKLAAWLVWRERLVELAGYCVVLESFGVESPVLRRTGQTLERFAGKVAEAVAGMQATTHPANGRG